MFETATRSLKSTLRLPRPKASSCGPAVVELALVRLFGAHQRCALLTADPLPSVELHNLLQEFRPKLAAAASGSALSSNVSLIPPSEDGHHYDGSVQSSVRVDWVLNVST